MAEEQAPAPEPTPEPAPAPEPEPNPEPAPEPAPSDDWRSGIPDGALADQAKRMASPTAAMQSIVDLRQKVSGALVIPGDDATDEERADFNTKLGVPASMDDIKINLPEGLDASLIPDDAGTAEIKAGLEGARAAGASQAVLDEVVSVYLGMKQQEATDRIEADKEFTKTSMAALEKEWGADTEDNKKIASNAASLLFGDDFEAARLMETSDGNFLLDHPAMMKMFAKIGREMGDSSMGSFLSDDQKGSVMEKADEFRAKRNEALNKGDNAAAAKWDEAEREQLAKIA